PKIEVRQAVEDLLKAGLKITVITGDYGPTAISIGKKVGLIRVISIPNGPRTGISPRPSRRRAWRRRR
ncbi:MAG: hypothetical protein Q8807_03990, partial ['Waltheria sp.' little leaf phytoplasma]|nr:hypothetical protein ['Waltheria sp.' little leaf phytoplasma]